jgi:TRAP-type C4-dicarboxylate transport system permease small subunit
MQTQTALALPFLRRKIFAKRTLPVKILGRIVVFVVGAALLFFGWHRAHTEMITLQNPTNATPGNAGAILVVIGGCLLLAAFVPSQQTLGRWMSLKRPKRAQPAHFRRRRRA